MAEDEQCQACRRWMMPLYIDPYRDHNLCYQCIRAWQHLDEVAQRIYGRVSTWQEYLIPRPSWFKGQIVKLEKSMLDELAPDTSEGHQYIRH